MKNKRNNKVRFLIMVLGNIFCGMGIGLFKLSGLGNDPYSGMMMSLADVTGIVYANFQVMANLVFFVIQFIWGRKLIGAGTIVNAVFLGYIVTFFHSVFKNIWGVPEQLGIQIVTVCIGVVILSFGLSLYQKADMGVAPYDSLSLITVKKWPKISYFWHRMADDALSALVCYLAGGIIGLGTLVCAFGLGPVIHFFDKHFTEKMLARLEG